MSKETLKEIIDKLSSLNEQELQLFDIGIQVSTLTSKWYAIVTLLLKEIYTEAQIDFIICYVYGNLNDYDELQSIKSFDEFYEYLINLKEDINEKIEE